MARPHARQGSLYFDYLQYPFITAPELKGVERTYPVAIVGAGPVGLTAALELARHGVSCVILDDKNTVNDGSRAICIARHSMEILQQLDIAERFEEKALPWTHGTSYYHEHPVYRLEMPHSEDQRFHPMYNLQQQYIEKFLIDKAQAEQRIDLRWQSKVVGVSQTDDAVQIKVETPEGEYELSAQYALAADGAKSVVRRECGLKLNGDAYEGRYVIADIRLQSDYPTERRAFFDPPSNPGLTVLVHKQPENIWRIDYQLSDEADEEEALLEENIRAKISSILDMMSERQEWELEWWSLYKAYTLALDDYRHGRILFIGDAAHLVPIFGVRGLNSGFADAMNAAWKLAYVVHGWSTDELLNSYSPERRGATLDVFKNAEKSTKFMTPPSRGYQRMRDAALSLAISHDFSRPLVNPRQSQPYTYADSPLSDLMQRDSEFSGGPPAGAPLVNRKIRSANYLLDYLGLGFSGLLFLEQGELAAELRTLFDTLQVGNESFTPILITKEPAKEDKMAVIHDHSGKFFLDYAAQHQSFYLLRPDRHICARWLEIDSDEVKRVLAHILGSKLI